ncbi:MAG: hypothetical protein AAFU80_02155 [Pseudomonadota bacterium]
MKTPKALPTVQRRSSTSAGTPGDAVAPSVNWGSLLKTAVGALPSIIDAF